MFLKSLIGYIFLISVITFILFGIDKNKARQQQWRIPEARLLLFSALGGSTGALAGMYFFHHKTKHLKFTFGLPFILFLQIAIGIYWFV